MENKKIKRYFSLILALMMLVTSLGISSGITTYASTAALTLHYASSNNTGVISELKAGYNHGKVMYGIINNEAAYCMNYGKSADGGQSMTGSEMMQSSLSDIQREQLLYCMYYGHSRVSGAIPDDTARNEYIATQAMVWIIEANLFSTAAGDSAAVKICNSAPNATASNTYYAALEANMFMAINQTVPSFSSRVAYTADTIELEWNESNNRYEKTITDSNGVLSHFNFTIPGVNYKVEGNKITFYTNRVITSVQTGTFQSTNGAVEITGNCVYWNVASSSYQEFVSTKPSGDPVNAYVKVKTEETGYGDLYKEDESTGESLSGAVFGIYSDKSCTDLVEKITTNSKGYAKSSPLDPATYYFKETKAPSKYRLSDTIHKVVVQAGKTTTVTATNKKNPGYIELYKKDTVTGVVLKDAVFGIYSNKACTTLVETLTTNSKGYAKSSALDSQTYYVKEITAPFKYVINTTVHTVVVEPEKTAMVNATDKEQKGKITIYKEGEVLKSWNGTAFVYETRKLPGATFKITAAEDIYSGDGTKKYSAGDLVTGNRKTGSDGSVMVSDLYLGKYTVTETASIPGYTINPTAKTVTLSYAGQEAEVVSQSTTITNSRQKAEVTVMKKDSETKNGLVDGQYGLYAGNDIKNYDGTIIVAKGTLLETATTGKDGKAAYVLDLPVGNQFYIKETKAPSLYYRNQTDTYTFNFTAMAETTAKAEFSHTFLNDWVPATVSLQKVDLELDTNVPQGDASLKAASYGLYAAEDILHPDGKTGLQHKKDSLVATLITNNEGKASVSGLFLGKYYVKELISSEGYLLDKTVYDIDCNYEGDLVKVVSRSMISREQVKKQPFQLIKAANNGETDAPLLKGAGFTAYLLSSLSVDPNGTYDFDSADPVVIGENGTTELFTDSNGYAVSIPIPYGTYIVRETTVPHNYQPVADFMVKITEHNPTEPQIWRILLDDEFEAKLRIIKTDSKTGKAVLVPNAEFKLFNLDTGEYVVQYTTYPTKVKHTSFFTDDDGDLILPEALKIGNYRIEEISAPDGYVVNETYIEVAVDSNTMYQVDPDTNDVIITVEYPNNPVLGELTIIKKGEVLKDYSGGLLDFFANSKDKEFVYQEAALSEAEFELYAAEDIYTNDYQTNELGERIKYYSKGELVDTLITGEDGSTTLKDIPLGNYRIVETKAPGGYVLSKETQMVSFVYVDDKTPVILESKSYTNERQKVSISVLKLDEETKLPLAGAVFGLYAAEDIKNREGNVILEAGSLLEQTVSGEDGLLKFTKDLPFGKYYAKEIQVPDGYLSNDSILEFDFTYQGQDTAVVELSAEFENTPTTVAFTKADITSEAELSGATLTVLDADGKVIETWISEAENPHIIKNLHVGETYTLREELAPYGYLKATDISFTVSDTKEIQMVEMQDEVPTGTIILNKDGEFVTDVNLAKGHWYDFIFQYVRENLSGVTFAVYAAEDIVSPDGLDTVAYEKDQLVTEIVTDEKRYAVVEGLPLGHYYLVETKTLEGFVLDTTPISADLTYVDQNTKIVYAGMDVENIRQKVKIDVMKQDAVTKKPLAGAVFGLYAAEDIQAKDGKVLVEKDTLVERAKTNEDGTCTFVSDLPLGCYYVAEEAAPAGYTTTNQVFEVDATYQGDDIAVIEYTAEFVNYTTKVEISKNDITGKEEVPGAELIIMDAAGNEIERWISERKPHLIERLPIGKYILREEIAPEGYVIARDVKFEVKDTAKVQKVKMIDKVTKGKILIHKVDEDTKKPIAGVEFTLQNEKGEILETLITDEKGAAESKLYAIGTYENGRLKTPCKYTVIETKTAEGYLLDETPKEVTFQWEDGKKVVIIVDLTITNKATVSKLPQTGDPLRPWMFAGLGMAVVVMGLLIGKRKKKS